MAPVRPERSPTRRQPRRGAGPPKPVYVPDPPKDRKAKKRGSDKTNPKKTPSRHYSFDWLLGEGSEDPLRRLDRWIPDRGQRPQPVKQPPHVPKDIWVAYCALDDWIYNQTGKPPDARGVRPQPTEAPDGVLFSLWLSYCNLDDYVYRYWLTQAEVLALPLADDVDDYNSGLRTERPATPPGFTWVDKTLVFKGDEFMKKTPKGGTTGKRLAMHVQGGNPGDSSEEIEVLQDFLLDDEDFSEQGEEVLRTEGGAM